MLTPIYFFLTYYPSFYTLFKLIPFVAFLALQWSQESLTCAMDTANIEWSAFREVLLGRYGDDLLFHFPVSFDADGRMRLFRMRDPCLPEEDIRTTEDVLREEGWSRAKEVRENGVEESDVKSEEGFEKSWKRSKKKENTEECEDPLSEGELQIELEEAGGEQTAGDKESDGPSSDRKDEDENVGGKSLSAENGVDVKAEVEAEEAPSQKTKEAIEGKEDASEMDEDEDEESDSQSIFEAIYAPEVSGPNIFAFEVAASRLEELSDFTQSVRQELAMLTAVSGRHAVSERTRHRSRAPKPETVTAAEDRQKQLTTLLKALERLKEDWKEIAPAAAEVRRQTQLRIRKEVGRAPGNFSSPFYSCSGCVEQSLFEIRNFRKRGSDVQSN